MPESREKAIALNNVVQAFREKAKRNARMIIEDMFLPDEQRRIKRASGVGGVAGGDKVCVC